jgi:hypothetical protein
MDYLRSKNIIDSFGGDYGINNPFTNSTFMGTSPMDPTQNQQMPGVPTQNSTFESQMQGKTHPAVEDSYQRLKAILDSYTPDTRSTDRLNNLLDNMPQMGNPSFARKLSATGAAIGNIGPGFTHSGTPDAADRVLQAPYLKQMADFTAKAGPFQAAATNENNRNIQERTLTSNLLTAASQSDKIASASADADTRNKINQQKADTADFVARHPKWTIESKGSRMYSVSPDGTQRIDLGESSNYSPIELQNIKDAASMARTKQLGANSVATKKAGAWQTARDENGDMYRVNPDTGDIAPMEGSPDDPTGQLSLVSKVAVRPPTATNDKVARTNRMQQLYDTDPLAQKWMTHDSNGNLQLKPRPTPGAFSGVKASDLAEYDALARRINPQAPSGVNVNTNVLGGVKTGQLGNQPGNQGGTNKSTVQQRAADFLKQNGQLATDANIQHAIQQGWVK